MQQRADDHGLHSFGCSADSQWTPALAEAARGTDLPAAYDGMIIEL
jgi:hypothetical protein